MQDDGSFEGVQRKYSSALRRVATRQPSDRLNLVARRENAALMADILEELHGDQALTWAVRMEALPNRTPFSRLVRLEMERRMAAKPLS